MLVTMQRSLIFPRPSQASSKRDHNGGALITLDAPPDLPADVGSTLAALRFAAPSPGAPVVVYFHGNADQVGWGGAYVGSLLRERGMGLFAIEYPGYGHAQSGGGSPTEDSLYAAADVLLKHLVAPKSEGGLEVPAGDVVLLGQVIPQPGRNPRPRNLFPWSHELRVFGTRGSLSAARWRWRWRREGTARRSCCSRPSPRSR